MPKTTAALQHLVSQIFAKPDETSLITNGQMFRHAVATPLSGLLLDLELANINQRNPYLTSALRQAERLKDLFELAHISDKDRQSFRVGTAIQETLMLLKTHYRSSLLKNNTNLNAQTTLAGNRFLFQEALVCALKNSLESYSTSQSKLVLINSRETDDQIIISIIDGGRGFTAWQKTLAFADGFSTKQAHQGVGMSWIKRVISGHFGGKVTLTSKVHHGSTMTWYLPKP